MASGKPGAVQTDKHRATELPTTRDDAIRMAVEREAWAIEARGKDLHGTARAGIDGAVAAKNGRASAVTDEEIPRVAGDC